MDSKVANVYIILLTRDQYNIYNGLTVNERVDKCMTTQVMDTSHRLHPPPAAGLFKKYYIQNNG